MHAAGAHDGENCRCVGGRNNNAQEQRNFKREADKIIGADKQEKGGQKHAGRGQYGTAHDNGFDFVPFGFQSAGKRMKVRATVPM